LVAERRLRRFVSPDRRTIGKILALVFYRRAPVPGRACAEDLRAGRRKHKTRKDGRMSSEAIINSLFVFMLAGFIGFEVIRRISPLLHTPLMSLTNALDAIAVVGAIALAGEGKSTLATILGTIAVVAAFSNVVGGFLITDRMLRMFKSSRPQKP
jgi:NAD(P) transhydrogenase subunit alpha